MAEKWGAAVPLSVGGELGPHLTMSPGPRPVSIPSGISDPSSHLTTVDMGRKVRGADVPLSMGRAASPSNTLWPGPRSTSIPSGILIHRTVWP